jgi:hypothetical protein
VVEQLTVNQLVVGSTPTVGAMYLISLHFIVKKHVCGRLFRVVADCHFCHKKPINLFICKIGFVFSF